MTKPATSKIDESELVQLLIELIKIPSVNPNLAASGENGEAQIAGFLHQKLENYGFEVKTQKVEGERHNIIAKLRGDGEKTLMLNGHLDTVSGSNMPDAFTPKLKDGKLWGRGSCDMKGGDAALIMAAKAVKDYGVKLKGDVVLALVVDEEGYGKGTQKLLETEKPDWCIIGEPTANQICLSAAGYLELDLTCEGLIKHGSSLKLDDGSNAYVNATRLLNRFLELPVLKEVESHDDVDMPNTMNFTVKKVPSCTSAWMTTNHHQTNILIGTAPCKTKRKSQEKTAKIAREMKRVVEKSNRKGQRNRLEIVDSNNGFIQPKNKFTEKFEQAVDSILGNHRYNHLLSFCDGTFYHNEAIPTLICGPGNIQQAHGAEYVELEQVKNAAKIYTQAIVNLLESK